MIYYLCRNLGESICERVNKQLATGRRQYYGVIYLSLRKLIGGEELPELPELPEREELRENESLHERT